MLQVYLKLYNIKYDDADDSDDNTETVAEEGVRGWLVVFASFICIAVLDGVGYTTGTYSTYKLIFSLKTASYRDCKCNFNVTIFGKTVLPT